MFIKIFLFQVFKLCLTFLAIELYEFRNRKTLQHILNIHMKILHLFSGAFPTLSRVQKVMASFCLVPVKGFDTGLTLVLPHGGWEVVQVTATKFRILSGFEGICIGKLPWLGRNGLHWQLLEKWIIVFYILTEVGIFFSPFWEESYSKEDILWHKNNACME